MCRAIAGNMPPWSLCHPLLTDWCFAVPCGTSRQGVAGSVDAPFTVFCDACVSLSAHECRLDAPMMEVSYVVGILVHPEGSGRAGTARHPNTGVLECRDVEAVWVV